MCVTYRHDSRRVDRANSRPYMGRENLGRLWGSTLIFNDGVSDGEERKKTDEQRYGDWLSVRRGTRVVLKSSHALRLELSK